jgi:mannose-6-phosphate isomerase-like protein (cupin superfamily)
MRNQTFPAGVIYLPDGSGRAYPLGRMQSVFKADGAETNDTYSISEWWLEPGTPGPGPHAHQANDDIFYVLAGTITFLVGNERIEASQGAFLRIPAGVAHDFENTTEQRAGLLNIYIPGGFEKDMPAIVEWFNNRDAG